MLGKLPIMVFSALLLAMVSAWLPGPLSAAPPSQADILTGEERLWLSAHGGRIRFAPSPTYAPVCFRDKDGRFRESPWTMSGTWRPPLDLLSKSSFVRAGTRSWTKPGPGKLMSWEISSRTSERAEYLRFTDAIPDNPQCHHHTQRCEAIAVPCNHVRHAGCHCRGIRHGDIYGSELS